jgi:FeS assembly SUF system protein
VWLHATQSNDQRLHFTADSDAIITKGLVALMVRVFDGEEPSSILQTDLHFIKAIGLHEHLSPTRSNGLAGMVQQIKNYAVAYQLKQTHSGIMTIEERNALEEKVIAVLKTIYDPEIPVDIYELGLIYNIGIDDASFVTILMTLTSPSCPVAETLPPDVEAKVASVQGVTGSKVEITWDPSWDKSMMSEEAQLELGFL